MKEKKIGTKDLQNTQKRINKRAIVRLYLLKITSDVNGLILQLQTESEGMGKDIPHKWKAKVNK